MSEPTIESSNPSTIIAIAFRTEPFASAGPHGGAQLYER
jgi:hypothetical protein